MNKTNVDSAGSKKTSIRKTSMLKDKNSAKKLIQKLLAKEKSISPSNRWRSPPNSTNPSLKDLQQNYKKLQTDYNKILDQIRQNRSEYETQQKQVQKWRKIHESDQKQLYRLRTMIGFIKKNDIGIQANMDECSRGSWLTKIQKSTQGQNMKEDESQQLWTPKKSKRTISPSTRGRSSEKKNKMSNMMVQIQRKQKKKEELNFEKQKYFESETKTLTNISSPTHLSKKQTLKQMRKLTNSPYSKLRFIPSPDLK